MDDLTTIAKKYGTDKINGHTYTPIYEKYFLHLRNKAIHIFELGVGGFRDPKAGGESLRMWKEYFINGRVTSLDIFPKDIFIPGTKIYRGNQADRSLLSRIIRNEGRPDIVIDDGSHRGQHQIISFEILFPLLADDGIYVIEDMQTSYWPEYGPGAMNYFKNLADGLNHAEQPARYKHPTFFDLSIISIHFYHNLIFIFKGNNNEPSNILK